MKKDKRKLPVGIQSFEMIRSNNYLYVDKTDLVWQIANGNMYNYLSRPRRFGKSILVDTFQCYFEGRKELFKGLKIMEFEKEWQKYPVIRLDMNRGGETIKELKNYLRLTFDNLETLYGIRNVLDEDSVTNRFANIIETIANTTGKHVVVLVDEYDYPLLHSWRTDEQEETASIYRSLFSVLKSSSNHIQFVFITGITKFNNLSLFSALNNLSNISFISDYESVCGITLNEIKENFMPEIERMSEKNKWTVSETYERMSV